jgi:hypothetical protein
MDFTPNNNPESSEDLVEVKIRALIVDPNSGSPVLILKDSDSEKMVPIWVGACEANAIASALENIASPRPMTHDLLRNFIVQFNLEAQKIIITELKDNTFYSVIVLVNEEGAESIVDARPSDAIALSLRCACPIYVNNKLLTLKNTDTDNDSQDDFEPQGDEWPDLLDDSGELAM